jgi:hypothetical protein
MKIRSGFVSNSSASSFIILLENMTNNQKQMIYDHINIGKEIDDKLKANGKPPLYEYYEDWNVVEDEIALSVSTSMTNFDLHGFIEKEVGIKSDKFIFQDDNYFYEFSEDTKYQEFKLNYLRSKKINILKDNIQNND